MKNIRVGSRESRLAVLQSEMVRDYIKTQHPELDVEILTMKTTGCGTKRDGDGLYKRKLSGIYTGTCDNENDRRQDPGSESGSDRWKRVVCKGTGCGFDGWTQ